MFTIKYHYLVVTRDIPKLDTLMRKRIKADIEKKLVSHPETFGAPLRRSLNSYRKLRVGDYRVIFKIEQLTVRILLIAHRSVAYQEIYKRVALSS
ncbi:MAG: type II toxin-antitoxin system RelE/ParE family toxin [Candidatus Harrisonbacteria bacterium]|nr:type II toxin-antitoxin system RelE/ParE family toxin [Candidatus Harrisonbacteria bacterium]